MPIETKFAPTGNLKPAKWRGRIVKYDENLLPVKAAPTVRYAGDPENSESRLLKWAILKYLKEHPGSTVQQVSKAIGRPAYKRLRSLEGRGYVNLTRFENRKFVYCSLATDET